MFNASFMGSIFNMKADVYKQESVQDPDTGAIKRQWLYNHTIQCKIDPFKMKNSSSKNDNKSFGGTSDLIYDERIQLKIYCFELLSKRWRIENIRTSDNRPVFIEIDKFDNPDTKFEVTAAHAILDPFGKIAYYESILVRSEVQDDNQA
jgi:hypothetical protein